MPHGAEWAHKARNTLVNVTSPIGYGANRALPATQFVIKVTIPSYFETLTSIIKTVFDACAFILPSEDRNFGYEDDFVWCSTTIYQSVWFLLSAWIIPVYPDDAALLRPRNVQLFWRTHGQKRLLPSLGISSDHEAATKPY
jgi:hypothetical protein